MTSSKDYILNNFIGRFKIHFIVSYLINIVCAYAICLQCFGGYA